MIGFLVAKEWYLALAALTIPVLVILLSKTLGKTEHESTIGAKPWYKVAAYGSSRDLAYPQGMTFGIVLAVSVLGVNLYAPAQPTPMERLLASFIILLASLPTLLWLSGLDRGIPFLPFFGGMYAVYYAFPIFLLEKYSRAWYLGRVIPESSVEHALALSFIGLVFLLVGYYGAEWKLLKNITPRVNMEWRDYRSVKLVAVGFGLIGMIAYYINLIIEFPLAVQQFVFFLGYLCLLSIAILFTLQLVGRLGPVGIGFLWIALVPARLLIGLGSGRTFQGLEVFILLVMVYSTVRHHFPWKVMFVGGLLLIVLLPLRAEFRGLTWEGEAADASPLEKSIIYTNTAKRYITAQALSYSDSFQRSISRLAHVMTFGEVVEATPAEIPFWNGETYYPLLFKVVPRILYPDKPREESGQTFGHRYRFLSPDDLKTSYNLPQVVELYANFGVAGVLVGMFMIGLIYKTIQHIFVHPGMGLGAMVSATYVFTRLIGTESSFSLVFGGLFWMSVFLGLVHCVMKIFERRQSPVAV